MNRLITTLISALVVLMLCAWWVYGQIRVSDAPLPMLVQRVDLTLIQDVALNDHRPLIGMPAIQTEEPVMEEPEPVAEIIVEPEQDVPAAPTPAVVQEQSMSPPEVKDEPKEDEIQVQYSGYLRTSNGIKAFITVAGEEHIVTADMWIGSRLKINTITEQFLTINVEPAGNVLKIYIQENDS